MPAVAGEWYRGVYPGVLVTLPALAGAAAVLSLGALLQSAAGFGFGLFAVPALLVIGFSLPQAVMLCVAGSAMQKVLAVYALREHVPWRNLKPLIVSGLVTLPAGLWLMQRLSRAGRDTTGIVVAALIMAMLLLRRLAAPRGRAVVPAAWGVAAGAVSGVLNGLANIGGPPVVLWSLAHDWSNRRLRVTTLAQSLVFVPFQVGVMILLFGRGVIVALGWGMLLSPLVILATRAGLRLGGRIPLPWLRLGMELLLILMALSAARPF